jgi:hypothetical protein
MGPRPGRTKTAVDKVRLGKKRDVNARFTAMTSHYVFEPPSIGLGPCMDGPLAISFFGSGILVGRGHVYSVDLQLYRCVP